ncbi:MAG TPA: hypothetical protein PKD85_00925 [Saprospiraceae bacterium]|nr:hypothetical protein [Saprospiraceae bacterium]
MSLNLIGKAINFWSSTPIEISAEKPWISYRMIIFTGIILIGGGYLLRGFAQAVDEIDDALKDQNE